MIFVPTGRTITLCWRVTSAIAYGASWVPEAGFFVSHWVSEKDMRAPYAHQF